MKLRREIEAGAFNRDVVAASLRAIVEGRAPYPYNDAEAFFSHTYPTDALRTALSLVLQRLEGRGGDRVLVVRSGFGGGKTHLLAAIYYFITQGDKARGTALWREVGGRSPPRAKVCVLDGVYVDPWSTPLWGWLGQCLEAAQDVALYVRELRPPDAAVVSKLLGGVSEPVVLILDEVGEYLRQIHSAVRRTAEEKRSYFEGVKAFIRALYDALREKDLVVISLPDESAPYDEEVRRQLRDLEELLRRAARSLSPVSRIEEVYGILRQRLFESVDNRIAQRKAGEYAEFYEKYRQYFREEWIDPKELMAAFPFHPSFIRTLYERTASIPAFQRTRDLLYVLARIAYLKRGRLGDFIMVSDVDLFDAELKEFFTKGVDRPNLEPVIEHDVKMARDKSDRHYAVAAALYVYSLIGGDVKRSAADRRVVRTLVARPGDVDPQVYDKALDELLEVAWYVDSDGERFWVSSEPNINKMVEEEARLFDDAKVMELLDREVEKLAESAAPPGFGAVVVRSLDELKDKKAFTLYVSFPPFPKCNDVKNELKKKFESLIYKNSAYFLLYDDLPVYYARYVLACRSLEDRVEKDRLPRLRGVCQNKLLSFYLELYRAYRCLAYPLPEEPRFVELKLDITNIPIGDAEKVARHLRDRLREALKKELSDTAKYMEEISPQYLYDAYLRKRLSNLGELDVKMLEEDVFRDPDLPALAKPTSLYRALKALADEGKIVLSCGKTYYAKLEGFVPSEVSYLFDCNPEKAISVLKSLPDDVVKLLEEARGRASPPVVTVEGPRPQAPQCSDAKWPGDVEFEASRIVISGEDVDMLRNLVGQLEPVLKIKPREANAEATLEDRDLRSEWSAASWEGVKTMVKYLASAERGAKIRFNVEIRAEFKLGKEVAAQFEKVYKSLKIEVYGKKCL